MNLQELESLMIMLYNQPRKFLRKIFIDFQTLVDYADLARPGSLEEEKGIFNTLKRHFLYLLAI